MPGKLQMCNKYKNKALESNFVNRKTVQHNKTIPPATVIAKAISYRRKEMNTFHILYNWSMVAFSTFL
jgi:hypothetical protein